MSDGAGGAIVVLAACQYGIGKRAFYDLAEEWDRERNAPADGIPRRFLTSLAAVLIFLLTGAVERSAGWRLHTGSVWI